MHEAEEAADRPLAPLAALAEEWLDDKRSSGRVLTSATEAAYRRDLSVWAFTIAELLRRPRRTEASGRPDRAGFRSTTSSPASASRTSTPDTIRWAAAALARQGYAAASRARMLAALKGLCRWLAAEGHLAQDPTVKQDRPGRRPPAGGVHRSRARPHRGGRERPRRAGPPPLADA